MIKGNWSLAADIRKNERKKQQSVQKRQKNQFRLEKLSKTDPIKLFHRIKRLEASNDTSENGIKTLKSLKDDWDFIQKKELHKSTLEPFLKNYEAREKAKESAKKKLWGQKSVYFNPELNPYGKVPVLEDSGIILPNATKPLKSKNVYDEDPKIHELDLVLPEGEPPRFYKLVQNTQKPDKQPEVIKTDTKKPISHKKTEYEIRHSGLDSESEVDSDGDDAMDSEEDNLYNSKKRRIN